MSPVVFRSKLDGWVLASLAAAGILQLLVVVVVARSEPRALAVVVPATLLGVGAVSWLYFATRYIVTMDSLCIRAGIFAQDIPLAQITSIEATRSPFAAPAWSLDRLLIRYGQHGACMVSPRSREDFLALLRARGARIPA